MSSGDTIRVFVHLNEFGANPKILIITPGDSMERFLRSAGKKLGIKARRAFLEDGSEVAETHEMRGDDHLYISSGDPFFKEADTTTNSKKVQLAVLGSGNVGKSAVTLRFVRNIFVAAWEPTIEDAYRKTVDVEGEPYEVEVVDTAGQEDFEVLRPQWMMQKDGYLFVFSLDNHESLEALESFYAMHTQLNESSNVQIILVGNKKDLVDANPLERQVTVEEARSVAERYGAIYMETSALTGEGVSEVFEHFVREVKRQRDGVPDDKKPAKRGWRCALL